MSNQVASKTLKFKAVPDPPAHLSDGAKALWTQIARDYAMYDDVVGLSILTGGLEAWDKAEAARRAVKKYGMQVRDRYHSLKPNPMLRVEAQFMAEYRAA